MNTETTPAATIVLGIHNQLDDRRRRHADAVAHRDAVTAELKRHRDEIGRLRMIVADLVLAKEFAITDVNDEAAVVARLEKRASPNVDGGDVFAAPLADDRHDG